MYLDRLAVMVSHQSVSDVVVFNSGEPPAALDGGLVGAALEGALDVALEVARERRRAERKDGEAECAVFAHVAHTAVHDRTQTATRLRSHAHEPTPHRVLRS